MKRALVQVFVIVAASLLPALAEEPKVMVFLGVQKEDRQFQPALKPPPPAFDASRIRLRISSPLDAIRAPRRGTPGATVVVWGDASQARQEEMQRFTRDFAPLFRSAFDAGLSASVGGQLLGELMANAGNPFWNPAPAFAPSVWYNAQDPWARDPKYWK